MLAAHHDQENIYTHQAGASKQPLQAKTPGARFPKTPLKAPLNDENANHGLGGKSVLRTKGNNENILTVGNGANGLGKSGRPALLTPAEPRTARAPLGNKTTNAKARATHQTPGVKTGVGDVEKTKVKPTTALRPKHATPQFENPRLEVHADKTTLEEEDIEYAPPKPKDIPYESDVFPDGVLSFEGLKPENLFRGYYNYYFNQVDDEGKTSLDRQMEEQQKRSFERGEEQIRKDMEEFDWTIGDIPESKDLFKKQTSATPAAPITATASRRAVRTMPKPLSTIASRKAASALAMPAKPSSGSAAARTKTPAQAPTTKSFMLPRRAPVQPATLPTVSARERAGAVAASRSTLGYNKGRSVSSAVHGSAGEPASHQPSAGPKPRTLTRSVSTASTGSEVTITPARYAQSSKDWKRPDFLSIFDVNADDDDDEGDLGGGLPPPDVDDEDFELTVNFH